VAAKTKRRRAKAPHGEDLPIEAALGFVFKDKSLLACALTHASVRATGLSQIDNERLEFLGDRVLGLVIAELLIEAFPGSQEGELARRYNQLVRRETCAAVAAEIGLGSHLVLSEAEEESGGRQKTTILADACEALLGAAFLDRGFVSSRALVRRLWRSRIGSATERVMPDAKSALQEWAQGSGLPLPHYSVVARKGPDHAPQFTAEVRVGRSSPVQGEGASKRLAEQAAATSMLVREGVWKDEQP
jgi:ribonuclease-3